MKRQLGMLTFVTLVFAAHGIAPAEEFEAVSVRFEQNATDKDVEVVFDATGGDEGLASIKVVAPDGRTVIDFKAPDTKLGLRHFQFESPEPKNDGSLQADFPAGEYTFTGTTVTGIKLQSKAKFNHKLPDTVTLVRPTVNEKGVPTKGLKIAWSQAKHIISYVVTIEQEESGFELTVKLPAAASTFVVPDGLLQAKTRYKLAIGTVSQEGNSSFVETSFTTEGPK